MAAKKSSKASSKKEVDYSTKAEDFCGNCEFWNTDCDGNCSKFPGYFDPPRKKSQSGCSGHIRERN